MGHKSHESHMSHPYFRAAGSTRGRRRVEDEDSGSTELAEVLPDVASRLVRRSLPELQVMGRSREFQTTGRSREDEPRPSTPLKQ